MTTTRTHTRTRRRRSDSYPLVAAFDMLCCLLLIFTILALVQKPKATPPRIDTRGVVAVKILWPDGSNDDVDLYVQDPAGHLVWFGTQDAGLMHLEYDDLGTRVSGTDGATVVKENSERVIIRGAVPGEYTVNVHMYRKSDSGTTPVTVELWLLRGDDRLVHERRVVLVREGQQETTFRFTLDANANASGFNTLPKDLMRATQAPNNGPAAPPVNPALLR